jgi:hypothetical protein
MICLKVMGEKATVGISVFQLATHCFIYLFIYLTSACLFSCEKMDTREHKIMALQNLEGKFILSSFSANLVLCFITILAAGHTISARMEGRLQEVHVFPKGELARETLLPKKHLFLPKRHLHPWAIKKKLKCYRKLEQTQDSEARKQHFILLAQTQWTRVQRLSPENKGVSPYIPL